MDHTSERRRFLQYAGAVSAALLAEPFASPPATARSVYAGALRVPDVEISLAAVPGEASVLPGRATEVWRYRAKVVRGDSARVQPISESYPGPILRLRKGERVRVVFENGLEEPSNIHWHGLHVPEDMDGHPRHTAAPGKRYVYEFEVRDRAGTYWFHPHPHGRTGKQIYFGLAGLMLISDDEERSANLPAGEYDLPLILQDRSFDADNQLVFLSDRGMARGMTGGGMMGDGMMGGGMMGGMMGRGRRGGMMDMMARMMGFLGDRIVVNGRPEATVSVASRAYRLRLLNASNTRIFKLAWDDGSPLTVIGTDGGLLEKPLTRRYVTLAPGERVELWSDFSRYSPGTALTMRSLPFEGDMAMGAMTMGRGMMGMMGNQSLPNGAAFPVFKVRVAHKARNSPPLPQRLSTLALHRPQEAANFGKPRGFNITMGHMQWGINGRSFEMEEVADEEVVKLGAAEIWEFANDASMGMMGMMAHPMHVHGLQFQILERRVMPSLAGAWKSVSAGYVDDGWKDEVLLMPGERARVLLRFEDYPGLFPYHCHMLEHGDTGLMRNYLVRA